MLLLFALLGPVSSQTTTTSAATGVGAEVQGDNSLNSTNRNVTVLGWPLLPDGPPDYNVLVRPLPAGIRTTTTTPAPAAEDSSLSLGAWLGIAFGVLLLALILGFVIQSQVLAKNKVKPSDAGAAVGYTRIIQVDLVHPSFA